MLVIGEFILNSYEFILKFLSGADLTIAPGSGLSRVMHNSYLVLMLAGAHLSGAGLSGAHLIAVEIYALSQ